MAAATWARQLLGIAAARLLVSCSAGGLFVFDYDGTLSHSGHTARGAAHAVDAAIGRGWLIGLNTLEHFSYPKAHHMPPAMMPYMEKHGGQAMYWTGDRAQDAWEKKSCPEAIEALGSNFSSSKGKACAIENLKRTTKLPNQCIAFFDNTRSMTDAVSRTFPGVLTYTKPDVDDGISESSVAEAEASIARHCEGIGGQEELLVA